MVKPVGQGLYFIYPALSLLYVEELHRSHSTLYK